MTQIGGWITCFLQVTNDLRHGDVTMAGHGMTEMAHIGEDGVGDATGSARRWCG